MTADFVTAGSVTARSVTAGETIDYPQPPLPLPAASGSRLIHQGELLKVFNDACDTLRTTEQARREIAGMSHERAASHLVSEALAAVNQLSDDMAFDDATRRQVDSALEALSVTVRTLLTEMPRQAPSQALEVSRAPASPEDEHPQDHRFRGLLGKQTWKRGRAAVDNGPDGPPAPAPPDETWMLADVALNATRKGLERVEKLFGQTRQPVEAPATPWHDNRELTTMIQQLLRARREENSEHAMLAIEQLAAALPSWGVDVVAYDASRRPEEQATHFAVTSLTDDEACGYEMAMPALLAHAPGGGRKVLARGEVRRLPTGTTTTPGALA